ncbi:PAS domain-containing protein, partial [candidate division KSB1 bacterium]|nr:PAS domain-containing protein [candidate division KSB1 bacterium]
MAILPDMLSSLYEENKPDFLRLVAYATDKINEGIVITDATAPNNPIIYANEGFERLTGYSRQEILGNNCHFLQGEGTDPAAIEYIRTALRQGVECRVDILNYRKDGSRFWNRLSIAPLRDDNGKIMHFVGVQSDITELKDTRESLERTNAVLQKFQTDMNIELAQAQHAQEAILPPTLPASEYIQIASKFVP